MRGAQLRVGSAREVRETGKERRQNAHEWKRRTAAVAVRQRRTAAGQVRRREGRGEGGALAVREVVVQQQGLCEQIERCVSSVSVERQGSTRDSREARRGWRQLDRCMYTDRDRDAEGCRRRGEQQQADRFSLFFLCCFLSAAVLVLVCFGPLVKKRERCPWIRVCVCACVCLCLCGARRTLVPLLDVVCGHAHAIVGCLGLLVSRGE